MLTKDSALRIEQLDPARHDRAGFTCGEERLDNFLKFSAKNQQKNDMTRVYVVVEEGQAKVLGYHAINVGMMNADELERRPRGAPEHGELPVLFLGQVAVCTDAQRLGIGSILMQHVFEKACSVADDAGCFAIVLDVMGDGGEDEFKRRLSWYEGFGFQSFVSRRSRMFMTMRQARDLVD